MLPESRLELRSLSNNRQQKYAEFRSSGQQQQKQHQMRRQEQKHRHTASTESHEPKSEDALTTAEEAEGLADMAAAHERCIR
jgi:hypothetical protein